LYENLYNWAVAFIDWATDVLMYDQEQEKIDELKGKNRKLRLEKARAHAIRDALQEDNLMKDVESLLTDEISATLDNINERKEKDYEEAVKY